jgi:hypothetical protein
MQSEDDLVHSASVLNQRRRRECSLAALLPGRVAHTWTVSWIVVEPDGQSLRGPFETLVEAEAWAMRMSEETAGGALDGAEFCVWDVSYLFTRDLRERRQLQREAFLHGPEACFVDGRRVAR